MHRDTTNRNLELAERALRGALGRGRRSETSFLHELLGQLGGDASAVGRSPAELLRSLLYDRPPMHGARDLLEVLATPAQPPRDELRPGDWMLRAVPGTGDVGHVAVLSSGDLRTPSALAVEGVAAESVQPGYYGLVVEAGAFPHSRRQPFARRFLDGRGRAPPNTVLLRPNALDPGAAPQAPPDVPELDELRQALDIEQVPPRFDVGHVIPASGVNRRYVRMPITFEDLDPRAQVIQQLRCDTEAEVDASNELLPLSGSTDPIFRFILIGDVIRSFTAANALWRTDAAGNLESALDLVVYYPARAPGASELATTGGPFPLVIICHGNHNAFETTTIAAETPSGFLSDGRPVRQATRLAFATEVTSHLGYSAFSRARPPGVGGTGTIEYLQEELARHGIVSVSVSTNGANLLNLMVETRSEYVLKARAEVSRFAADSTSRFFRKIDFNRVAYVGHSRGGDAVLRAVHKDRSAKVRALVQLAPTDMRGLANGSRPPGPVPPKTSFVTTPMRITADLNLKYLCICGSRDGDVSGWTDERTAWTGTGFRHYDRASAQRAFQFWHGATHNRFNRFWADAEEPFPPPPPAALIALDFLDRIDQERRTNEAVGGWLRYVLNGEVTEAGRFNGRMPTAVAPRLPVVSMWKFGRNLKTIDRFDDDRRSDRNTLGGRNSPPASGFVDEVRLANDNPPGAGDSNLQFMHIDPVLRASLPPPLRAPSSSTSTSGAWRAGVPPEHQDFSRFTLVTLRVTKRFDERAVTAATTPAAKAALLPTITISLRDRAGGHASAAAASSGGAGSLPDIRHIARPGGGVVLDLTKYHFETWEVAVSRFPGVDLRRVASVEVEMAGLVGQSIYVDTLSLVQL